MNLDTCIKRITRYLGKSDNRPRVVNVNNIEDLKRLKEHFNVGTNIFVSVKDYSKPDNNPSISTLFNDLLTKEGSIFLTEFTTYMKLKGDEELNQFLNQLFHSSFSTKLIVLCYQCEKNLEVRDLRFRDFIYRVEGEYTKPPKLIFVRDTEFLPTDVIIANGIENLANKIESNETDEIYVKTKKSENVYSRSLYFIVEENNPFQILCNIDGATNSLNQTMGSDEEWLYALKSITEHKSWEYLISNKFGSCNNLEFAVNRYQNFNKNDKWFYFIALKLYGAKNHWCLNKVSRIICNSDSLLRTVYRSILDEPYNDEKFWDKYNSRKDLVMSFGENAKEANDYCQMVRSKGDKFIYYLTDNTKQEKEMIFEFMDKYADDDNYEEILEITKHVFPDLYEYLNPYWFDNELLDNYFQTYKYQKVVNKIFPDFKEDVEEQAYKREYNLLLSPRSSQLNKINNKENSALFFMDAMGVEFLSYIIAQCKKHNLIANTTICRCELPSLTQYNKEFIDVFETANSKLIHGRKGIKDLDELKHDGIDGANYESTKLPIHLIKELEIIEGIIKKIDKDISQGDYGKAVLISDHGASRLAVINENENKWEMATKGQHSGRCCPVNEIDNKPEFATEENDFWVLANYDRFKGGRKSDVEVHGGASLEEVAVPIIEIMRAESNIELEILTPEIKFNIREKNAEIKIFSKTKISDVVVEVEGCRYKPIKEDEYTFVVKMPDLKKAKTYKVKVFSNNNVLTEDLKFTAKKEGFTKRKLF